MSTSSIETESLLRKAARIEPITAVLQMVLMTILMSAAGAKGRHIQNHSNDSDSQGAPEINSIYCWLSMAALTCIFATFVPEACKAKEEESKIGYYFVALKSIPTSFFFGIALATLCDYEEAVDIASLGGGISFAFLLFSFTAMSSITFFKSRYTKDTNEVCLGPSAIFNFTAFVGALFMLLTLPQITNSPEENVKATEFTALMLFVLTIIQAVKASLSQRKSLPRRPGSSQSNDSLFADGEQEGEELSFHSDEEQPLLSSGGHEKRYSAGLVNESSGDREAGDAIELKDSYGGKNESWGAWFSRQATAAVTLADQSVSAVGNAIESCSFYFGV